MFPGRASRPGLHIALQPGLTLVLGANGLGKTTLVTLLYRMCTGPYEIPGLAGSAALGNRSLEATRLQRWEQRVLAARVMDDAASATARLKLKFGDKQVELTRALDSLRLTRLICDGQELQPTEERFHELISDATDLPTFGDWILILRYLVFYFEDRRALVWDPSAQRQILRLLLLPKTTAAAWATREREVLELDSRVRNLQATLNREEMEERRSRVKLQSSNTTHAEIDTLDREIRGESDRLESINALLPDADAERQRARLRSLTAEQERDSSYRELERLQLTRIAAAFPSHVETARYLIGRLLSTDVCQTCGNHVPEFASALEHRLVNAQCVVCGTSLPLSKVRSRSFEREIQAKTGELESVEVTLKAALKTRQEAEEVFDEAIEEHQRLESSIARRRARRVALIRVLPPDERTLRQQTSEITSLRGRLEGLKRELDRLRDDFEGLVKRDMATIAIRRHQIIEVFALFAEGFLFESCELKWSPHKARVANGRRTLPTRRCDNFGAVAGRSHEVWDSWRPRRGERCRRFSAKTGSCCRRHQCGLARRRLGGGWHAAANERRRGHAQGAR